LCSVLCKFSSSEITGNSSVLWSRPACTWGVHSLVSLLARDVTLGHWYMVLDVSKDRVAFVYKSSRFMKCYSVWTLKPCGWGRYVPSKRREPFIQWHSVASSSAVEFVYRTLLPEFPVKCFMCIAPQITWVLPELWFRCDIAFSLATEATLIDPF
jgi:hypothetical protein